MNPARVPHWRSCDLSGKRLAGSIKRRWQRRKANSRFIGNSNAHARRCSRYAANPRRGIGEITKSAEIWNRSGTLRTIDDGPAGHYAKCVGVQVSQNRDRMHDLSAERTAHERAVNGPRKVKYDKPSSLTTSLSNVTQGPGLVWKRIKRIEQVRESERIASQREERPYCIPAVQWRNSAK